MQCAAELGHATTADSPGLVDPKNAVFIAVKSDRLARGFEIGASRMKIGKGRLALDKLEVHQPTRRAVGEHEQRRLRSAVLKPSVLAAVDLDQLADTVAPGARRFRRCLRSSHSPASIIHSRSVSRPSVIPCTSRSFSAASVGPKSQYHSRIIASAAQQIAAIAEIEIIPLAIDLSVTVSMA
jgi:hypothetical protein